MKIALLSTFPPFRGGIAQFNVSLMEELGKVHTVRAFTFKRQYPGILFPGKSQYLSPDDAKDVGAERLLDTINPFTWCKTARKIREWKPDLLVMKYWMPWFAPSLGKVARKLRRSGTKVVVIPDNVIPHERHLVDIPLTKYFLRSCDGFVTMSDSVTEDLKKLLPDTKWICRPHPLYSHFGEKKERAEAERHLGLAPGRKNILFFGLIREYKGLDILLEAFRTLPEDYQLIVAGEPYGSFAPYQAIIDSLPGKDRIHVETRYIPDSEVPWYFSAADLTVLPYRTATQSGISAISCHFDLPMVVTDAGGLGDTVSDRGTGLNAGEAECEAIRSAILRYFADPSIREGCLKAISAEKERLSWSNFASSLVQFAETL